ncbi:nicalin-1-like [Mytilus californianus]|uniref:nicalin-1-like n=1 Tax=Mytilus californianus TaxID=6549 RepID=UPI0022461417|nr:nicalin-1-like [Mytilus californianus]
MVLEEMGELLEMFKHSFPLSFLFFIPILVLISPVNTAHEFSAFRMQQYDLHGSHHGCQAAQVNMEARPIDAKMITRRCIVTKMKEFTMAKYRDLIQENAGALLIILPRNLTALSEDDRQHLQTVEKDLAEEGSISIPVYFAEETDELLQIYDAIQLGNTGDQAASALEALMSGASANGFQMVVGGPQSKSLPDFQITNIQGHLSGFGIEEQLPTIAVVAHYDAFGVAPGMSVGADSNGSGVIALLELARLFSKLYTNSRTHAKYNLIFLLSGGGKFNYQGTKRWIEDNIENQESSLLTDVAYVLCLDSLGKSDNLFLHVSKPPKEGTAGHTLLQNIEDVSKSFFEEVKFKMNHKKINLAEDMLAWEHERFSIKRLPAFTMSSLESHKNPDRTSILDKRDSVEVSKLTRNIQILAEALAKHVYNLTSQGNLRLFSEGLEVQTDLVSAWLNQLTAKSRATQLLHKDHHLLSTLEETMNRYLKDVKRSTLKADKRDPEFIFYDGSQYVMSAYNVKPAIFDLFLAAGIVAYLGMVYLVVQNFSYVYLILQKFSIPRKTKVQ